MNALQRLQQAYPLREARALYELVMERRFGLSRTDVLLGKDTTLSADEQEILTGIIDRLLKNEPVQYVLGVEEFCGRLFHVTPSVLIPRPETQLLVRLAMENVPTGGTVLDIGTGSGCISISLALEGYRVSAMDVSKEALKVAAENASALGADVSFILEDILRPQSSPVHWDAIVSNPPYICHHEASDMAANVLDYEPHLALFVTDDDPLCFYRAIGEYGCTHLRPGGQLFFEINRAYPAEVSALLSSQGYTDIQVLNDQYDNPRIVYAKR